MCGVLRLRQGSSEPGIAANSTFVANRQQRLMESRFVGYTANSLI